MNTNIIYIFLVIVIGVLMPFLAIRNSAVLGEVLRTKPEIKVSFYVQGIIIQWILTSFTLLAMYYYSDEIVLIGLPLDRWFLGISMLITMVMCSFLVFYYLPLRRSIAKFVLKVYLHVAHYLPTNQSTYRWGVLLSITAGICEEIIYRGFLLWQFSTFLDQWLSIMLLNIIFALTHYGTGLKNALWSFVLGSVFSVLYLITGDLLLPIIMHVFIDLLAITLFPKAYRVQYSLNN